MTPAPARFALAIVAAFLLSGLADAFTSALVGQNVAAIEAHGLVSGLQETNSALAPNEARLSAYLAHKRLALWMVVPVILFLFVPRRLWRHPPVGLLAAAFYGLLIGLLFNAFLGFIAALSNLSLLVLGTNPGHLIIAWLQGADLMQFETREAKYRLLTAIAAVPAGLATWAVLRRWPLPASLSEPNPASS